MNCQLRLLNIFYDIAINLFYYWLHDRLNYFLPKTLLNKKKFKKKINFQVPIKKN